MIEVSKMKRICFVDFDMSVTGGVEQVTASLVNSLCDKYNVFLYEINSNGEMAYEIDERVVCKRGLEGETRLRHMIQKTFKAFVRFVKENKIDIVIMMGNYPALVVGYTRIFTGKKYVYCDHGGLMNQWHQKDITTIRFIDAFFANKVVVLTQKTKEDYIKHFHTRRKKVVCIYNWIEEFLMEAKQPYNSESKKIISVGRFGKEKGYDMAVEVAKKVLPKNTEWIWEIYGDGETFEEISQKVIESGLQNQLILKGNLKNAYTIYKDYAMLVLPSYREGLPIVLLEALALGIPMVSFDIETGPNEIIEDGKNGFLIPPYDIENMSYKINELITNDELRKQFSLYEGRKQKFSKRTILNKWCKLIETI